ncbi:hypothetical protein IFM89_014533 [Coptis chinensis]|uniref:CCHC-type domain-containing protein n=1 Tax=Coptis chinensis TaxID=261450 RepID=A0A835H8B0_9MAGN|nr:hypothetical protein IFM89_014533 [Coptis chinensis]
MNMATEEFIDLKMISEQIEVNITTTELTEENIGQGKEDGEIEDDQLVQTMDLVDNEGCSLVETIKTAENISGNGRDLDESPRSGVKRARMTYVDQEPSVHVVYNSLTRASKRKLEELLQHWSKWHTQQNFSTNDPNEIMETGEQTFFPALHFGVENASTVSFWIDNQTSKEQNNFIPLDGDSVPTYDRGYAFGLTSADSSTNVEGGVETQEVSRCFNCGSYSHSLKDCRKPRDNAAVDNARKEHQSKRNQTVGSRSTPRYYQSSHGGKYDEIRPGVLSSETRQFLGLGELDPPPWLRRMREIGYPPGYFDPEYEDQPSGITIYAEETLDGEDGEILGASNNPEPKKKMSVEFPGINAPIPENADEIRWASSPGTFSFDASRNRIHLFPNRLSDTGNYGDARRSRECRDDGPPGCNLGFDTPRYSGFSPTYASDSYSPRGYPIPRSTDRGRWNPLVHDDSPSYSPNSPVTHASLNTLQSPQSFSSANSESRSYGSHHNSSSDFPSRRNDRQDHHRHRRK